MRIAVIGTGYVGLVSGACFSAFGVEVVCVDNDAAKIARLERGEMPIYEPGLEALVAENVAAGRLSFTTDLRATVAGAEAVFIAVGTPSRRGDGHADLTHVFAAAEEIGRALDGYSVVVTKSTVPVGTGRRVRAILERVRPGIRCDVAANPEFLREGSAIEDFMRPDRVVIGTDSERARAVLRALYRPLYLIETPMLFTTIETAELIKYAANAFLATKITFINEVADLCEAVGADVQDVAKGIGLDGRIGRKFLHAGPGFGGSCFPKDCRALVRTAREAEAGLEIVEAAVRVNDARKRAMADKIVAACGGTVAGKRLAVLGLTFKPNTDDMRDAPSLVILPALADAGAVIRAFDPEGMAEAKKLLPGLVTCSDPYEAMAGADALVLLTEWNAFRALDLDRVRKLLRTPLIVDLRNIYEPQQVAEAGLRYVSIGRPAVPPAPPSGEPTIEPPRFVMAVSPPNSPRVGRSPEETEVR
jgi:UDPglucose 6-dehydrogenase